MKQLIDQDITHVARMMRVSLLGDLAGPILPSSYWRKRVQQLRDVPSLTKAQLCAINDLLLELDAFDTGVPAAPVSTPRLDEAACPEVRLPQVRA
ncbi:hypothetical protein [Trinickia mobilis]|uniref:hypothetical protein n=1 Tax=Trinickia mobilis TaxID=2816356 RepID=UPI001A8DF795|nr:hypothetical protein [Trinickia mobilis]